MRRIDLIGISHYSSLLMANNKSANVEIATWPIVTILLTVKAKKSSKEIAVLSDFSTRRRLFSKVYSIIAVLCKRPRNMWTLWRIAVEVSEPLGAEEA
jgi:hypothetical protein